jgi:hypothetical protein
MSAAVSEDTVQNGIVPALRMRSRGKLRETLNHEDTKKGADADKRVDWFFFVPFVSSWQLF